jgi:hypothetical protein
MALTCNSRSEPAIRFWIDTIDPTYYTVADGRWVATTSNFHGLSTIADRL